MNKSRMNRVVLGLIAVCGLVMVTAKPIPPPKRRAARIQAVNRVDRIFITLPRTNASPAANLGK